jgi:hypothetical protein
VLLDDEATAKKDAERAAADEAKWRQEAADYQAAREAERAEKGRPIRGGVSVSTPGDGPRPEWMGGDE